MKYPAALGGIPTFSKQIPFNQPTLPPFTTILPALRSILRSGTITKGPIINEYETAIRSYLNVKEAVAVSSCTIGLTLVLQALKQRHEIHPDNQSQRRRPCEVVLPSFTFPATAHACLWNNLIPVYVDCNPNTFLIDPNSVEEAITSNTLAILAVHVFGNPVEAEHLLSIAQKHSIFLLFDSAHGFGSLYKEKPIGGNGIAEVFSTSPTKLLATGEGGVITTNDLELAEHLRIAREYGNPGDYNCIFPGTNGRMSELHALLGIEGLKRLSNYAERRRFLAAFYKNKLNNIPGIKFQLITPLGLSSFKDIAIIIEPDFGLSRDQLKQALSLEGIPTRTYFDPPLHKQIFSGNITKQPVPLMNTENIAGKIICLPITSHMPTRHITLIAKAIHRIYHHREAILRI